MNRRIPIRAIFRRVAKDNPELMAAMKTNAEAGKPVVRISKKKLARMVEIMDRAVRQAGQLKRKQPTARYQ